MGVCIYSGPDADPDPGRYVLMHSIRASRQQAWSRFRRIDRSEDVMAIIDALQQFFARDPDIHAVSRHNDHLF